VVKRGLIVVLAVLAAGSCATPPPEPPSFFIEDLPPEVTARLTLDERIATNEAWQYLRAGRSDRALRLIGGLGPGSLVYAVGLGYVSLLQADLGAAEDSFLSSLREVPEMTPAHVGLAQIYAARGDREQTFLQYREILKRDPDNRWAGPRLEALRETLTRELFEEAAAAKAEGRPEEARTAYLKVLFYDPDSPAAHYELGLIYLQEGNTESAVIHFEAFLERDPETNERRKQVLRAMAEGAYAIEEFGRSLHYYEELGEIEAFDPETLQRVEQLKARLGIYELPSQYASIPALEAIAREDLAALIGVKFRDFLDAPGRRTRIVVDIATSWAQKYIVDVASLDLMAVFDNHTFQPRRAVNRAELAETAVRLIRFLRSRGHPFVPLIEAHRIQISDVTPENFYYPAIVEALSYQIMALDPLRRFEPERPVTGREAARVMDIIHGLAR
jgi:tetratricopeptide (TPR) repeat protein